MVIHDVIDATNNVIREVNVLQECIFDRGLHYDLFGSDMLGDKVYDDESRKLLKQMLPLLFRFEEELTKYKIELRNTTYRVPTEAEAAAEAEANFPDTEAKAETQ